MEDITEAEALADIEEGRTDYDDIIDGHSSYESYYRFLEEIGNSIKADYRHYERNKNAKVGTNIMCAENRCQKRFVKKSYQQAFCCTKHKNQFWNRQRIT